MVVILTDMDTVMRLECLTSQYITVGTLAISVVVGTRTSHIGAPDSKGANGAI